MDTLTKEERAVYAARARRLRALAADLEENAGTGLITVEEAEVMVDRCRALARRIEAALARIEEWEVT